MHVGNRIRMLRNATGISVAELASNIGLSQPYLSQIELGKRTCPLDSLESVCSHFGITLGEFFGYDPDQVPPDLYRLLTVAKMLTTEQREALTRFIETIMNIPS